MCQDTKSCGCLRKIASGEANFNKLYNTYKKSVSAKKLGFSLSKDEFIKITSEICFYCKTEPKQKVNRRFSNGTYIYNGIDRKDNSKGYTPKNAIPCCFICNRAKSEMSYKDFIKWIQAIKTR